MIETVFTIDYEIYGNGEGSLRELVYEPAQKLISIFRKWKVRFVNFVEVAELELIEAKGTDPAIDLVKNQIREMFKDDFEVALHLHPQWYNGRYENGRWRLDNSEYNLCTLPRERIIQIADRSIAYLRGTLEKNDFRPVSFRAGNWLFQPTRTAAEVLAQRGIKVDSSVFKGGLQHKHHLDYRSALKNGYFWHFSDRVEIPDPRGALLELPIYTKMVPTWQMFTAKRVSLQRKGGSSDQNGQKKLHRLLDFLRPQSPLKLDFCRMTIDELTRTMDRVVQKDEKDPEPFRPIVAIGHTKDLVDYETVEAFLSYLAQKRIKVSIFQEVYPKCQGQS